MTPFAVCILAGGQAKRFPGKLEQHFGQDALIARVFHNVGGTYPVYISAKSTFSPQVDRLLDCPLIVDRFHAAGPLGGLLSAFGEIRAHAVFVVPGDAPFVNNSTLEYLRRNAQNNDEAVVGTHDGYDEPLIALYDRLSFIREGFDVLHSGTRAVKAVLAKLKTRRVELPAYAVANVNTPGDLYGAARYEVTS